MTKFLLRNPARDEELPVIRLDPKNWNRRVVVWIDRRGKQALFAASGAPCRHVEALAGGFAVIGVDLLGQGEFTADGSPWAKARLNESKDARTKESRVTYAGFTFGYNRPLFSERVHDLLSLVAFLRSVNPAAEGVDVVGLNGAGHWVAAARAIAGNAIDRAAVDTAGFRFADLTALDDPDFLPGGAKYGDLPGMIAARGPASALADR